MSNLITNYSVRQDSIDPSQSFIVQAPAGSGKTELLIQRFLHLLSYTEKNPEEIIAITFTRKAASEMRQRIITALNDAANNDAPETPHKQLTWQLAKKALQRDHQLNWQLQKNSNRLRIMTIDALSAYLVKQMPISAKLSPQLTIVDHALPYYREAAEQILLTFPMENLLLHLDNRVYLLEDLLVEILSKREQWLPHIIGHQNNTKELRNHMENALKNVALECMQAALPLFTDDILAELIPLADFAGQYCKENDPHNTITHCNGLTLLSTSLDAFPQWLAIANLLLTQKGEWRKSVNKNQGFPARCKLKPQVMEFLKTLSSNDALKSRLHAIMHCPPLIYNDQQWEMINTLIEILPLLAAQLNLLFARDSVTDFVELNLAALRALGEDENPTDLALHLDYRINHLLIDEFQDTSLVQFQLIEKLIAGWSANDGRTIFLVGDPMQSIYRFRNAEVGLFIRVQEQGIGNIQLKTLTLKENFRSCTDIVGWNNKNFQVIFPNESDVTLGTTPYSPAHAQNNTAGNIQWHPRINDDGNNEANSVVDQIQILKKAHPTETVAILVRSRTHLVKIIDKLNQKNITFQAIDLEPLSELIEIQDIHSLTRALLHRADRIAWLGILRAPYCGLILNDLTVIAEASEKNSVWTSLKNYLLLNGLTLDAKQRLDFFVPTLFNAVENIGRQPFSCLLRELWKKLNGPGTLQSNKQERNIENYFQLIEKLETQHIPLCLSSINARLESLYSEPNPNADNTLQIMTIHKAKGLEFDHVFLPGLHRKSPHDTDQILKWLERPTLFGDNDLILAPIKAADQEMDPIYSYLRRVDKAKADYECGRLLYVATTRAKKSLHLFANAISENDTLQIPAKGTFLNLLWNSAKQFFLETSETVEKEVEKISQRNSLRRFTTRYFDLQPKPITTSISQSQNISISLENSTARHVGTLIHEALEQLAAVGSVNTKRSLARLKQMGISEPEIKTCLHTIECAIQKTQEDPRGQWILSNQHREAHCEFSLTLFENDRLNKIIIDRCFIDNGIRWIIDYKTGTPTLEELNVYREQLNLYADAFRYLENLPIQLGLYFPLTGEWIEWVFEDVGIKC